MVRLPVLSGEELLSALKRVGAEALRQRGSHVPIRRVTLERTYRSVVPLHRELAHGTLRDILRQIGITKDQLVEILQG